MARSSLPWAGAFTPFRSPADQRTRSCSVNAQAVGDRDAALRLSLTLDGQIALADWTQPDSRRSALLVHVIDDPLGIAVGDLLFRLE
jgi:hypothetical protein